MSHLQATKWNSTNLKCNGGGEPRLEEVLVKTMRETSEKTFLKGEKMSKSTWGASGTHSSTDSYSVSILLCLFLWLTINNHMCQYEEWDMLITHSQIREMTKLWQSGSSMVFGHNIDTMWANINLEFRSGSCLQLMRHLNSKKVWDARSRFARSSSLEKVHAYWFLQSNRRKDSDRIYHRCHFLLTMLKDLSSTGQ